MVDLESTDGYNAVNFTEFNIKYNVISESDVSTGNCFVGYLTCFDQWRTVVWFVNYILYPHVRSQARAICDTFQLS